MDLSSVFSAPIEARTRVLQLKPDNVTDVHILYKRGFYAYLNELLFQGNQIIRKALQHLSEEDIVRCKLYGLVFAYQSYKRMLSPNVFRDFLLEFVETSYPYREVDIMCDIDELLELSLTNNRLQKWLLVQGIRMPTLEDFVMHRSMYIPQSQKLRDMINRNLLEIGQGQYAIIDNSNPIKIMKLHIRFGILPDFSHIINRRNFIVAYERTQNVSFIKKHVDVFQRSFRYIDFFTHNDCAKLFEAIPFVPILSAGTARLLTAVHENCSYKFCLALAKLIDWNRSHEDSPLYSDQLIADAKLPFAYTRLGSALTPEILVHTYLRNGFPVYVPFLIEKNWWNVPLINNVLWFKGYSAEYCEWTPENYSLATKWQLPIKTIFQISICPGNLLHVLPKELLFELVDALIVVDR